MSVVRIESEVTDVITDEQVLDKITKVFQSHSYDAINTDQISSETGIAASELRQRFPDGKTQMVTAILKRSDDYFRNKILSPLNSNKPPEYRIVEMAKQLKIFYQDGYRPCLLETLSIGNGDEHYRPHLTESFTSWCSALEAIACESGFTKFEAQQRAEQVLVAIEGALVFARITGNNAPFQNCLTKLPSLLTQASC